MSTVRAPQPGDTINSYCGTDWLCWTSRVVAVEEVTNMDREASPAWDVTIENGTTYLLFGMTFEVPGNGWRYVR
jgi:hypothetical protein